MNSKQVRLGYRWARENMADGKVPEPKGMGESFRYGVKMFLSDHAKGVVKPIKPR